MKRNDSVGFPELLTQLKITNRLLAAQLRSTMRQNEVVALLASTGATYQEIADVLDTTSETFRITVRRMKSKKGTKSGTKKASAS